MSLSTIESTRWLRRSYDKFTERTVSDGTLVDLNGAVIPEGADAFRTVQTLSVYKETIKRYTHSATVIEWENMDFSLYTVTFTIEYGDPGTGETFTRPMAGYVIQRFTIADEPNSPKSIVSFDASKYGNWYASPGGEERVL